MPNRNVLIRLVVSPRARLGFLAGWALAGLVWMIGSGNILEVAQQADLLTLPELFALRLLRFLVFLGATGALLYVLLGRQQSGVAEGGPEAGLLIEASSIGVGLADASGLLRYANPAFTRLLDLSPALIGQTDLEAMVRGRLLPGQSAPLLSGAGRIDVAVHVRSPSGRETNVQLDVVRTENQGFDGYLLFANDVTALRRVTEMSSLYTRAFDALPVGVAIVDARRPAFPMTYVNAMFVHLTGYDAVELTGSPYSMLQPTDRIQGGGLELADMLRQQTSSTMRLKHYRKNGEMYWVEMTLMPIVDGHGQATHFVAMHRDISRDQRESERLSRELYDDRITSVSTRAGFLQQFKELLSNTPDSAVVLLRLDIQNFHEFNTALGWDVGDSLLVEVANRLRTVAGSAAIGRIESNQFAVALPVADGDGNAAMAAVRTALQGAFVLPGTICEPVIALGWTVGPVGTSYRELMQQSAIALNEARSSRFGETRQYDTAMEAATLERRRLTAELKRAVQDRDFVVHYQPRVELRTGQIQAAEALVRWSHPLFGIQGPARFIELAEDTGMIVEIGETSILHAVKVAAEINRDRSTPLPISVNVALTQFRRKNFVALIARALADAKAQPSWLQLELTESIYTSATPDTSHSLFQLHEMGVGLIIDDFATGYSSLRYLMNEPVDEIKIDRGFIAGLEHNQFARAVVQSIISVASAKQTRITAEAVETERQREILLELGCTLGQGYLFSLPLPHDEFRALIASEAGTLQLS